jgi:hypothetical protein
LASITKNWLVACFAVSIISGFVPSIIATSMVEGHPGDSVATRQRAIGTLECTADGSTNPAGLILSFSSIVIGGTSPKVDAPTAGFKVTKLDLDPIGPRTHLSMEGILFGADNSFNRCIPLNEPIEIRVSGDIDSDCLKKTSAGTFNIEVQPGNDRPGVNIQYVGSFDSSEVYCQRNPTPTGSTICQTGANSDDNLVGTSGNDCINGNSGSDTLIAGEGNDKMNGGDGRDRLIGGDGNDELTGGPGPDTFVCGPGTDKIIDFKPSEGDKKTSDCEQF